MRGQTSTASRSRASSARTASSHALLQPHPELVSDPGTLAVLEAGASDAVMALHLGIAGLAARMPVAEVYDTVLDLDVAVATAHDEMVPGAGGTVRSSNRAGGLEGGMTNGEVLRVRVAMKPISTVPRALSTVDVATGEAAVAINQRSDVCAVPAAGVVAEAMVALVLADAALEKFGGDSLAETLRNVRAYRDASRPPGACVT